MRSEANAPALATNVGPAFASLALALERVSDHAVLRRTGDGPLEVSACTPGPRAALAREAAQIALEEHGGAWEIELLHGAADLALGGKTPALVAAWCAARRAIGASCGLAKALSQLCPLQQQATGLPDPAGVAAALGRGGGWTVDLHPSFAISLPIAPGWVALCRPELPAWSARARRDAGPKQVPLMKHARQAARAGALGHLLCDEGAPDALVRVAFEDAVAEPGLGALFPGLHPALRGARRAGALGSWMSGAGPTLCAFARTRDAADASGEAMRDALAAHRIECAHEVVAIATPEPREER